MPYQESRISNPQRGVLPVEGLKYKMPDRAITELNAYVADLEAHPRGKLVGKTEFEEAARGIDRRAIVASLPPALTEEDFVQIVNLALLTECATDAYAEVFYESGRRFGTPWLNRFTRNIWVPDEYEHADPFKSILLNFGFSEAELDRRVKDVQEMTYEHTSGETPVHLTMFGMIQEELTDGWYTLIRRLLQESSPITALGVTQVKKRETLHRVWYGDMTAVQITHNTHLIPLIADALVRFQLPGNKLVPELEAQAERWIPLMGGDFREIERQLVTHIGDAVGGGPQNLGATIIEYGAIKSNVPGVTSLRSVRALSRMSFVGLGLNTLVGQAVQEHEGVKPHGVVEQVFWNVTAPFRKRIVTRMEDFSFDPQKKAA